MPDESAEMYFSRLFKLSQFENALKKMNSKMIGIKIDSSLKNITFYETEKCPYRKKHT